MNANPRTNPRVLVVDDDAVVGRSFDRVLSAGGYAVSTALSGEEAMEKIGDTDYDVVFTDIKMPGMDGLEFAERIMKKCPWTPVVVVTGYGTAANETKAAVLGVSGFIRKPLTPEIIESVTLKALDEKERAEAVREMPEAAVDAESEKVQAKGGFGAFVKNVGLFLAAPFVALGYIIALPFVGFYMVGKLGYKALTTHKDSSA
jgi:DNA-binding NtrC family response regulator